MIIFLVVQFLFFYVELYECKPQFARIICCRRRNDRWGWCSLCTRRSVSLLLSLSLFFLLLLLNSRSSRIYVSSTITGNGRLFLSCVLFIRQEKNEREEEERKKKKNVDEQYSSLTRLVKCTTNSFSWPTLRTR